jgi:hypothetical protein
MNNFQRHLDMRAAIHEASIDQGGMIAGEFVAEYGHLNLACIAKSAGNGDVQIMCKLAPRDIDLARFDYGLMPVAESRNYFIRLHSPIVWNETAPVSDVRGMANDGW